MNKLILILKHFVLIFFSFFLICSCTGVNVKEKQFTKEDIIQYRLDSDSVKLKTSYVKVAKDYGAELFDETYMQHLHSLDGKYPHDIETLLTGEDVWEPSPVRMRLMDLMGKVRFAYLKEYCDVCPPIEAKDEWIIMQWCQAHACNTIFFKFAVDTKNNNAYALANIQEDERDFSGPDRRTLYYESDEGLQQMPYFVKRFLFE